MSRSFWRLVAPRIIFAAASVGVDINNGPRYPKLGDIIGCSDGDVGIVKRCYFGGLDDDYMVEVIWSSGETLTDPWRAQDYWNETDMFHIMSRA